VSEAPAVSVVIAAYESHATVAATLEALRRQRLRDFEAILVDSSPTQATVELVRARFPEVRVVYSTRRLLPHAARNRGVELSRGRTVAFTDADCEPDPGWLEALAAAHVAGHAIAGGPVACLNRDLRAQAIHVAKFASWLPGQPSGSRPDLPSANLSVTRRLLEQVGAFPEDRFAGDTELAWRARANGITPAFVADAVVGHRHEPSMRGLLAERRRRGRDFGLMRPVVLRWSRRRLLLQLAFTPLIPFVIAGRVVGRAPGRMRLVALLSLPLQLAGAAAWALGEARSHIELLAQR
jgi:GT2 family glycosyltransferase